MSVISAKARLRSRSAKGILRRFHWVWAPFALTGMLAGPCAAAYADPGAYVPVPCITGIDGSRDGYEHGHRHHPECWHMHEHEHQASASFHLTTIRDGCCIGVKAGTDASGKSPQEPGPPSHVVMVASSITAEWLAPPSVRTALSAVDRSQSHQILPPGFLVTRRIRD
jgi:hypothetical protein